MLAKPMAYEVLLSSVPGEQEEINGAGPKHLTILLCWHHNETCQGPIQRPSGYWGGSGKVETVMSDSEAQTPQAKGPDILPPENNDLELSLVSHW